tara:strand:+ start:4821 stop:5708 length:888 start_codon:yes stop_codon:yes gene_type:complete
MNFINNNFINNNFNYNKELLYDNSKFLFHPVYKKCIIENNNKNNVYNFGYKIIDNSDTFSDFFSDVNYDDYMEHINKLNLLFNDNNLEFGAGIKGQTIMKRLKQSCLISNFNIFKNLYKSLFFSIEKKIFNSKIKIIDINAYRNCLNNLNENVSSWLWHFDNHPNEMIKMMIYLTDVDEESSPMEIIVDKNNNPIRMVSNRVFEDDWNNSEPNKYFKHQFNGNRLSDSDITNILDSGYKIKPLHGKKGTIILFSENIIHHATYPKSKERQIINTVLAPSIETNFSTINNNYKWFL